MQQVKQVLQTEMPNGVAYVQLAQRRYVNQLVKQGIIQAKQVSIPRRVDASGKPIIVEHMFEIRLV